MQPRCAGKRRTPSLIQADSAHDLAVAFLVQRCRRPWRSSRQSPRRARRADPRGSGSVALETTARRDRDGWVLDGAKRWIGKGSIADVVVVWPRSQNDGQVKGFLVERETPGFRVPRARWQADISLEGPCGRRLRRSNVVRFENQAIPRYGRDCRTQHHRHRRIRITNQALRSTCPEGRAPTLTAGRNRRIAAAGPHCCTRPPASPTP